VSFRAPRDTQFEGYSWYDINFNDPENFIDVPQAKESLNAVLESIMKIINHYGLTEGKPICAASAREEYCAMHWL
jgi:phospholipase/carboxylesterase